ncbi:metallophosphoesterase [Bosea beijingensis]
MIDTFRLGDADYEDASAVYAVGDIHGRLDLLDQMEAAIAADIAASGAEKPLICYLGDYIDRGPNSAQVIDRLASSPRGRIGRVFLKGNHEDRMVDFLVDPAKNGPAWMKYGGREALESYGLIVPNEVADTGWTDLRDHLDAALPDSHRAFLNDLRLGLRWRGYLFVHAGLDPQRPATEQMPRDLMWIREPFLSSACDWGFKVVHGHVVVEEPVFRPNRIGIDTGAYRSGRLTCLVLDGGTERLIQT